MGSSANMTSANVEPERASAQPPRRRWTPVAAARVVRRLTMLFAFAALLWFWNVYGMIRVPMGMDTTPRIPAGSSCLVDKRGSIAKVGHDVFCDVPDGGVVLSRVLEVTAEDQLVLRHESTDSRLPDSRAFGPLPRASVRGVVLFVFAPEPDVAELPIGR
jgi:hypothetical protein